ncbi:hypothetical protein LO772_12735 [Yinghuangia sp. ASG 101]|uniref:hypothetical protein n=1 Tax=Yinghuangia sp. ASG 101 TaxID=2896848 RepID=UPI001E47CB45|nr:hypothetical protein [Yinghuangia sp. ASG 101]UGQ14371.1 hypothetical protein LO772_12735 [Yinghuangia sp. ASG 101]
MYRDAYRSEHLPARRHGRARDLAASPTPQLRRFGHELARGLGLADDAVLLRTALRDPDHACRTAAGYALPARARGRDRDRTALRLLKAADSAMRERGVAALPPVGRAFVRACFAAPGAVCGGLLGTSPDSELDKV